MVIQTQYEFQILILGQVAEGMVAAVDAEEVALARAFQIRAPRLPRCASWTDMAVGVTVR